MAQVPTSINLPGNVPTDIMQIGMVFSWLMNALRNWIALAAAAINANSAIGEYHSSIVLVGAGVNIDAIATITSLSLPAGDWEVWGEAWLDTATGAATVSNAFRVSINLNAATTTAVPADNQASTKSVTDTGIVPSSTVALVVPVGPVRFLISSTTSIYLNALQNVSAGTAYGYGKLCARRWK
jgi:hypothetical protein